MQLSVYFLEKTISKNLFQATVDSPIGCHPSTALNALMGHLELTFNLLLQAASERKRALAPAQARREPWEASRQRPKNFKALKWT